MTIAISQTLTPLRCPYTRSGSGNPRTGDFISPPATGELIVVRGCFRFEPDEADCAVVISDNKGNTYSVVKRSENNNGASDDQFTFIGYAVHGGSGSGTHTISWYLDTASSSYALHGWWAAHSYSSNGWSNPLDKSVTNANTSSHTSLAATSGTLAQTSELLVTAWNVWKWDETDFNVTGPSTWTSRHLMDGISTGDTTGQATGMHDLIVSATTTQTATYSHDSGQTGTMVLLSFKESASSGNAVTFTTSPIEVAVGAAVNVTTRVMSGGSPVSGVSVTCTSNLPEIAQVLDDTPSSGSVVLTCTPGATQTTSPYQSDNNVWGANNVGTNPWSQCTGLSTMQSGSKVNFRTVWTWPNVGDDSVKAYPEIIYGQKPGHTEVGTTILPIKIDDIVSCTAAWDGLTETMVGARGQFTFDLWLQADATSYTSFYAAPKTHEIMLPISAYGTPQYGVPPNRNPAWLKASNVTVDSRAFNIYDTGSRNFGDSNNPWRFVVYQPLSLSGGAITSATINWRTIFTDMKNRGICTGQEYLVAIEIGVEPIFGQGDSLLTGYKVTMS